MTETEGDESEREKPAETYWGLVVALAVVAVVVSEGYVIVFPFRLVPFI
jgi:hypothetical protein